MATAYSRNTRTHWDDDTPESSPLVSPDEPCFSLPPLPHSESTKPDPFPPLSRLPVEGRRTQNWPCKSTNVDATRPMQVLEHPSWRQYNRTWTAEHQKCGSLGRLESDDSKPLNTPLGGCGVLSEPQRLGPSPFPATIASSRSMGFASLRVDAATANGSMSSASLKNGIEPGAMGQWKPSSTALRRSGWAAPRSSPTQSSSGCTTAVASTSTSPTSTQPARGWSASALRRNNELFTRIQEAAGMVEKFEGTNYPSWSYWFKRKVTGVPGGRVWGHIDGSRPRPSEPSVTSDQEAEENDLVDRWDMNEATLYCALFASIDSTIARDQIQECTTAKEIWDRLELLYGDPDAHGTRAAKLIRELSQVTYIPGNDLRAHLRAMQFAIAELQRGPYPIPDSLGLWFIYDSMPGCFVSEVRKLREDKEISLASGIQRLKTIGEALLGEQCVAPGVRYRTTIQRGAVLPLDLRHYKYRGNGELGDGELYRRAGDTCSACLATGHLALSEECPQTEARLGLWGREGPTECASTTTPMSNKYRALGLGLPSGRPASVDMVKTASTGPSRGGKYDLYGRYEPVVAGVVPAADLPTWRAT